MHWFVQHLSHALKYWVGILVCERSPNTAAPENDAIAAARTPPTAGTCCAHARAEKHFEQPQPVTPSPHGGFPLILFCK